jgi:hypothetical protein
MNFDKEEKFLYQEILKLKSKICCKVRNFAQTSNLTIGVPLIVTHNLKLQNQDDVFVTVKDSNVEVSVTVTTIDSNTLSVTSLSNITNARISILGF